MTAAGWAAVVSAAGVAAAALLPMPEAIDATTILRARVLSAALTATAATAMLVRGGPRRTWIGIAVVAATAGAGLVVRHVGATTACVATYDGRPVLIGRAYTPAGQAYVAQHPGESAADLLLDAGGVPDRVWTPASIASCGFWAGWAGLLALPLFAASVCAVAASRGLRLGAAPATPVAAGVASPRGAPRYDAFLSYRHTEPDRQRAEEILEALESRGVSVAIDVRDFVPNRHFLAEMERCITTSRFVLCIVTARYIESDHCVEEAVISKTLDMSERTQRVVPLIFEAVPLPVWLHGLVGIDFTEAARVDPVERLVALLRAPASETDEPPASPGG